MTCFLRFALSVGIVVGCLMAQGCGVKLFYNNADRLARWWVSDYIDMSKSQRQYFDASTADIMYWHRTTQLALYRKELLAFANTVEAAEFDKSALKSTVDDVERWAVAFNARTVPVALDILLALSPEQRTDFYAALRKSNRDYEREASRAHADRAEEEAKDYAWLLRKFTGRLSPEQRALILEKHLKMLPDAQAILDYRVEWQQKLLNALDSSPPRREVIEDLMVNFDEHYTPEFERMISANEVVYQDLTLELLNSLSAAQRVRLVAELREYAQIFAELIAEAPSVAPPPVPALPAYPRAP